MQDLERHRGRVDEERVELPGAEDFEEHRRLGDELRGTGAAGEERDLSEVVTRSACGDQGAALPNLDFALVDDEELGTIGTFAGEDLAGLIEAGLANASMHARRFSVRAT